MLVWTMATTFPTVIVATAKTHMMAIQSGWKGPSAEKKTRTKPANPAAFTPVAIKAVIDVGAPSYTSGVHI